MLNFAANLSLLYPELDFLDRFEAAANDGFKAVECLFPYAYPAPILAAKLQQFGLQQVLVNAPPAAGNADEMNAAWASGARGLACIEGQQAAFRGSIALALDYAAALRCPRLHVMAGAIPAGQTAASVRGIFVENLRYAAQQAAPLGVDILIEPLNARDQPNYFLSRQADAHALVQEIGQPNVKVQFDLYHCQITEGDLAENIRRYLPTGRVGHIQIAGVPQRHEPNVGEVNYPYVLGVLAETAAACGWQGWVGCEYRPALGTAAGGTSRGLAWMRGLNSGAPC